MYPIFLKSVSIRVTERRDLPGRSRSALTKVLAPVLMVSIIAGCASDSSRMGKTAGAGALFGAGVGLLLGAIRGEPAAGLAAGVAVGGAHGAYEGWRQDQDDERTRQITEAIRESSRATGGDAASRAREELTRFLGVWALEGWAQEPGEDRLNIRAMVQGNVEMNYFVELAYMDIEVPGLDTPVWGTSMLGYDEHQGYTINTRFNTLPEPFRLSGTFDPGSRTFTFAESGSRVVVRFESPDRFTTETFITVSGREHQFESYRFTRD